MASSERVVVPMTKRTLSTPVLSDAVALTGMVPDTVAPLRGAVNETVGGVVSGGRVPANDFGELLSRALPPLSRSELIPYA